MLRRFVEWAFPAVIAEIRREAWAASRAEAVAECKAVLRQFKQAVHAA